VAIVGGGIGGASCAYFLNKFAPGTVIDIYEKEGQVGGRLKHVVFGGEVCEVGGDAWSSVNTYLMEIKKELDVQMTNDSYDGNGKVGFYEGNGKWYEVKESIFTEMKYLVQVELFRYRLAQNYEQRDKGPTPFTTIEEFVQAGGLDEYTSTQMDAFMSKHGVDEELAFGEVWPIIRGIYDQNLTISAFGGIVSTLPALTDAYSVLGGNSRLVEMLLNNSKASVYLNSVVTNITWTGDGYQVSTANKPGQQIYDSVVIAHPIEFGNITYSNFSLPSITPRHYQHWFVTLVLATGLQPSYFGSQLNPIPDNVFTTGNTTAPFVVVYPIAQSPKGAPVYKIFSNVDMTPYLADIFVGMTDHYVQVWPYTFPDLYPQKTYQPVNLAQGLYYVNAIESVASAMEMSTIAGRNIALQISANINSIESVAVSMEGSTIGGRNVALLIANAQQK